MAHFYNNVAPAGLFGINDDISTIMSPLRGFLESMMTLLQYCRPYGAFWNQNVEIVNSRQSAP
jgi:hypothetical protein